MATGETKKHKGMICLETKQRITNVFIGVDS